MLPRVTPLQLQLGRARAAPPLGSRRGPSPRSQAGSVRPARWGPRGPRPALPSRGRRAAAAASGAAASADTGGSLEALIADVLNENRAAKLQRPADLLALIDATGNGLRTSVKRSWDTSAVGLSLEGVWAGGAEARKMAMLAVYQERLVTRAALLRRLLTWLLAQQPGLLDGDVERQVEQLAAANDINPALQVLMVPQLTLMAAALYPWPVLARTVEAAVQAATEALLAKPPYNYSPTRRQAALQQLAWVEASLCRGAALARLRALLLQQGQLPAWQQRADAMATAAALQAGAVTAEQAYHEVWKQQQQQQVQGHATAGARDGRCLLASFHQRAGAQPWLMHAAPGTAASAASASAAADRQQLAVAWDVAAAAGEQQQLCRAVSALTERTESLKQQLGSSEAALGVLPEVQRAHRAALLDLCIAWADASPALPQLPQPPVAAARVAVSSVEHDRLLRRIGLEAAGPEVEVLRQLAKTKGHGFLAHFSPSVGNPFASTPEWDYFRECPGVFARFVIDPSTDTARLTFKPLVGQQQQQQQAAAASSASDIQLSHWELQQLLQQLLLALSGAGGSSSTPGSAAGSSGSLGEPGKRRIELRRLAGSSSKAAAAPPGRRQGGGSLDTRLELLVGGVRVAELQPQHVASLVTVAEDLVNQLPEHYAPMRRPPAVQITSKPPVHQALGSALSGLATACSGLAATLLLALPLLAIARPFRGPQPLPAAGGAAAPLPHATARAASGQHTQRRMLPVNGRLSGQELQRLCSAVEQQVVGLVWLPRDQVLQQQPPSPPQQQQPKQQQEQPQQQPQQLMFQVVVDRQGGVLGVQPCSPAAALVVLELPLAAALYPQLATVHARRLEVITGADAAAAKPAKRPPKPSCSQLFYDPVQLRPLPPDGVVVLRLELVPAVAAPAAHDAGGSQPQQPAAGQQAAEQQQLQQQQQQPVVRRVVGKGKSATEFWLMQPRATAWTDADSLAVWRANGAVLQDAQPQPAQASAAAAAAGSAANSGSLSVTLDGQQLESVEALLRQLLAANARQAGEGGGGSPAAASGG